jgi:excisionase family DNA binding protein
MKGMEDTFINDGLLGIDEAANYLGVTKRFLRELYLSKKIRGAKPNYRTWAFRREDLDAYLNRITQNEEGVYA